MHVKKLALLLILLLSLVLVACGGGAATEEPVAGEETTGEETTGALPDLGGREITVAVENAYLPFNYIDPATGEPVSYTHLDVYKRQGRGRWSARRRA